MTRFDLCLPGAGGAARVVRPCTAVPWRHAAPALLALFLTTAAWATAPPIDEVLSTLHSSGAKAALARHFDCNSQFAAYDAIATGQARWLDLALRLLPEADACYSEGLHDALGRAMRAAPRRVLPLVGSSSALAPERVCLPFISAELPRTEQLDALHRSRRAITAVRDHALSRPRRLCLDFIDSVERQIRPAAPATPN
jgi:hypothetical protein